MAMNLHTTANTTSSSTNATYLNKTYYDRKLLENAKKNYVYAKYGQKRNIPKSGGKTVEFRKWGTLTPSATFNELTEGTVPDGLSLTQTAVTATVKQYGAYVAVSDLLDLTAIDPVIRDSVELLGDLMGNVIDRVARAAFLTGTNVQYAGTSHTTRASVTSADVLTVAEIRKAVRTLKKAGARMFTSGEDGSARKPHYVCICSPDSTYDLQSDTLWQDVSKYSNAEQIYSGEIGRLFGVVFVETSNGPTVSNGAASAITLQQTFVFGKDAYGIVDIAGSGALQSIVKPHGSAGTADPLDQMATVGAKVMGYAAVLLNGDWLVRIEHAATE